LFAPRLYLDAGIRTRVPAAAQWIRAIRTDVRALRLGCDEGMRTGAPLLALAITPRTCGTEQKRTRVFTNSRGARRFIDAETIDCDGAGIWVIDTRGAQGRARIHGALVREVVPLAPVRQLGQLRDLEAGVLSRRIRARRHRRLEGIQMALTARPVATSRIAHPIVVIV